MKEYVIRVEIRDNPSMDPLENSFAGHIVIGREQHFPVVCTDKDQKNRIKFLTEFLKEVLEKEAAL